VIRGRLPRRPDKCNRILIGEARTGRSACTARGDRDADGCSGRKECVTYFAIRAASVTKDRTAF
jgi:hypothetical protein